MIERRLARVAARLRQLREELAVIDEQLAHFNDDADDKALRALVSETPGATFESGDARRHADAMERHRAHVVASVIELERRQDELLDELSAAR
jgi:hypothetical protein